jgi:hypothetical protein
MAGRGTIAVGISVLALLVSTAGAVAGIGDKPTGSRIKCDRFIEPCSQRVVLAEGDLFDGPFELIGFTSKYGLCMGFDHFRESGWSLSCGPARPGARNHVAQKSLSVLKGRVGTLTDITGLVDPAAAQVRIDLERLGHARQRVVPVAPIAGELQQKLELRRPTAVFSTTWRKCIPSRSMRFTALDAAGAPIGDTEAGFDIGCAGFNDGRGSEGWAIWARGLERSGG